MKKYIYEIKLTVEVEAYNSTDAWEAVQEVFGIGESYSITVTECEYRDL